MGPGRMMFEVLQANVSVLQSLLSH
jgi:hypothetical protein